MILLEILKGGITVKSEYQVEYRTNGIPKIFEFYLFVNPLGYQCYNCERELTKTIDLISAKTDVHILCFHSQNIVTEFMNRLGIPSTDLTSRNHIYRSVYLASIAHKAASMQGKKKGRRFLMEMQSRILGQLERFSDQFVLDLAEEIGLDMQTFIDDLESDYAKHLLQKDQQIARDMNVENTPALVIFEHRLGQRGVLLEGPFKAENILTQLDVLIELDYLNDIHKPKLALVTKKRTN